MEKCISRDSHQQILPEKKTKLFSCFSFFFSVYFTAHLLCTKYLTLLCLQEMVFVIINSAVLDKLLFMIAACLLRVTGWLVVSSQSNSTLYQVWRP